MRNTRFKKYIQNLKGRSPEWWKELNTRGISHERWKYLIVYDKGTIALVYLFNRKIDLAYIHFMHFILFFLCFNIDIKFLFEGNSAIMMSF